MKVSELKQHLQNMDKVRFQLPNGKFVPAHFHVTEMGKVTKHLVDCGGKEHTEESISIQLWSSVDLHHRLAPSKFLKIIDQTQKIIGDEDLPLEVEYQGDTIGKYGLDFDGENILLTGTATDCRAKEACGITPKVKKSLKELSPAGCCAPASGCC